MKKDPRVAYANDELISRLKAETPRPHDKFVDPLGECEVCGRPVRNKNIAQKDWRGPRNAVTAYNDHMCQGCWSRGGVPPKTVVDRRYKSAPAHALNDGVRPPKRAYATSAGVGSDLTAPRVTDVERAAVTAAAARRMSGRALREVLGALGLGD